MADEPMESVRVAHEGQVAIVTIDRPKALNALSRDVLEALVDALAALGEQGAAVRGVILTGEGGRAFAAGADLRAMSSLSPADAADLARLGHAAADAIEAFPAPVVAAVDGFALGGGLEMAMACDLIYATDASHFGLPEVHLGLIPGFGGTVRLPRLVGPAVARDMIYTGRRIDTAEAVEVGLVAKRFPDRAALLAGARATIDAVAANSWSAVGLAKRVLTTAAGTPTSTAHGLEIDAFEDAFRTEDMHEGVAAFLEKREPRFSV